MITNLSVGMCAQLIAYAMEVCRDVGTSFVDVCRKIRGWGKLQQSWKACHSKAATVRVVYIGAVGPVMLYERESCRSKAFTSAGAQHVRVWCVCALVALGK